MPEISILVPEATVNLIKNPSFKLGVDGWVAGSGVTISQSLTRARFGTRSMQVVTDGSVLQQGVYFRVKPNTSNTPYAGSAYLRGSGIVRVRVEDGFNGKTIASKVASLDDDLWQRLDVTGRTGSAASDDLRLYVETYKKLQAVTFYVDGAQIEQKEVVTSYCDGDQEGCRWNIQEHNSESSRDDQVASGGRWEVLAPFCRNEDEALDKDLYITELSGFGMPLIRNNTQSFAIAPGAFLQRAKILARPIILTFWAVNKGGQQQKDNSLARLQELRQLLIDLVKPGRIKGSQPVWLRYQGEDSNVVGLLSCHYEAGLELEIDIRNYWLNNFPLRMLAVDPLWIQDSQEVF